MTRLRKFCLWTTAPLSDSVASHRVVSTSRLSGHLPKVFCTVLWWGGFFFFFLVSGMRVGMSAAGSVLWGSRAGLEPFLNQSHFRKDWQMRAWHAGPSLRQPRFKIRGSKIQSFLMRLLSFELENKKENRGWDAGWVLTEDGSISRDVTKRRGSREMTPIGAAGLKSHEFVLLLPCWVGGHFGEKLWGGGRQPASTTGSSNPPFSNHPRQIPAFRHSAACTSPAYWEGLGDRRCIREAQT